MNPTTDIPAETLLVDFLNTLDVEAGTDVLGTAPSYAAWARERGVVPGTLAEARSVRDALRLAASGTTSTLPAVPLSAVASEAGVVLLGDTAPRSAIAAATNLTAQGRFSRIKLCPCDTCQWAFYDQSRNASRAWCDMAVCGNRVKARTFREKALAGD